MNREEILKTIRSLAKSQGFYGRLLEAIEEDDSDEFIQELIDQQFKDSVDLILYLEQ